jgi:hypothetical protein
VTVYVPGGTVAVYLPSAPTVTCWVTGPAIVTDPGSGFAEAPAGPPTATRLPVSVAGPPGADADADADDDAGAGEDPVTDDVFGTAGRACVDAHAATSAMAARISSTRRSIETTIERLGDRGVDQRARRGAVDDLCGVIPRAGAARGDRGIPGRARGRAVDSARVRARGHGAGFVGVAGFGRATPASAAEAAVPIYRPSAVLNSVCAAVDTALVPPKIRALVTPDCAATR